MNGSETPLRITKALLLVGWMLVFFVVGATVGYVLLIPSNKGIDRSRYVVDLTRIPVSTPPAASTPASSVMAQIRTPKDPAQPERHEEALFTTVTPDEDEPIAAPSADRRQQATGLENPAQVPEAEAQAPASAPAEEQVASRSGPALNQSPPPAPKAPRKLWEQFAAHYKDSIGPEVALVITELGLSREATDRAIHNLLPEITLSFSPYSRRLNEYVTLARANGHEVMIDLPLEPQDFPNDDPGRFGLLTSLSVVDNLKRLDRVLDSASAYVGVAAHKGGRFLSSPEALQPVLDEIKNRGLIFLDNASASTSTARALSMQIGVDFVENDGTLDDRLASRVAIAAGLARIERIARDEGFAVAMASPYPSSLAELQNWIDGLKGRGLKLIPLSAIVAKEKAVPSGG